MTTFLAMNQQHHPQSEPDLPVPPLVSLWIQPTSPCVPLTVTPTAGAQRHIAIRWSVPNYLRPENAVILIHICPTSVLYGANWGYVQFQTFPYFTTNHENTTTDEESQQKLENEFDLSTTTKVNTLAQPLVDAQIPFKIHIVKDHDLKERLCFEVERLGLNAMIMGSREFGAARRTNKGRLGSVSDYYVHHYICPVVVVWYLDEEETEKKKITGEDAELQPVPEEEPEYYDAEEKHRGLS
ncbi:hypothetical protein Gogos_020974 [Gossypium gossypioides]|uniref:UspA domain-containing protein n=1 Tax=Gossypium gossypioides TaxID=34282 RepID=A0A7J9D1H6_GOSGO|nr:hypothetical protein [Gossypium gossypioides]